MDTSKNNGFPWSQAAYIATAVWMVVVLVITGGKVTHPFFNYIFIIPLGVWVAGLLVARVVKARRDRAGGG